VNVSQNSYWSWFGEANSVPWRLLSIATGTPVPQKSGSVNVPENASFCGSGFAANAAETATVATPTSRTARVMISLFIVPPFGGVRLKCHRLRG
jgi:hypothetical protein